MINPADRLKLMALIDQALEQGVRLSAICRLIGLSSRTVQRWRLKTDKCDGRMQAAKQRTPANTLSDQEQQRIVSICNQARYSAMAPNQIVPDLADQGIYVASESSFYRVLRQAGQAAHRCKSKAAAHHRPEPFVADAPNQLWSWDITYLPTNIKGLFFYLYMIMDVFSRKIVGWEVHETESADNAAALIRKAHLRQAIGVKALVLHADNGSPMKGATMLSTLQKLGIMPSFSRPSVSNDNAYSEALFKTLKYHTGYPDKPFESIEQARKWVSGFVYWYNEIHRHSALKFVTPAQRHRGQDIDILQRRKQVYLSAKMRHPARWSGSIRNWQRIELVCLNPNKSKPQAKQAA